MCWSGTGELVGGGENGVGDLVLIPPPHISFPIFIFPISSPQPRGLGRTQREGHIWKMKGVDEPFIFMDLRPPTSPSPFPDFWHSPQGGAEGEAKRARPRRCFSIS